MTKLKKQLSRRTGTLRVQRLLAVLGAAVVLAGIFHFHSSQRRSSSTDTLMPTSPALATLDHRTARPTNSDLRSVGATIRDFRLELQRAEAEVETARLNFANAHRAVSKAESLIAQSERDLADLERFVEELEEQGEDPADHADEGLQRFMPAFEAYELADEAVKRAEAAEAIERIKLVGAEQRLLAAQRRLDAESPAPSLQE